MASLADAAWPVNLVTDLCLAHKHFGSSSSNPVLNGHLHYAAPADINKPLYEAADDKARDYRDDYNNCHSNSFFHACRC